MALKFPQGKILIFTKTPVSGQVKTRLYPALSHKECADLHQCLIRHTLNTAISSALCPVELYCAGDIDHVFIQQCAQEFSVPLHPQKGSDLGQRMSNAVEQTLAHSEFVLIIGCDCVVLTQSHLLDACNALDKNQVVLIPAEDGGYVLIGLQQANTEVFENINWGNSTVMLETRNKLKQLSLSYTELETLWDIDRPEDLQRLPPDLLPKNHVMTAN